MGIGTESCTPRKPRRALPYIRTAALLVTICLVHGTCLALLVVAPRMYDARHALYRRRLHIAPPTPTRRAPMHGKPRACVYNEYFPIPVGPFPTCWSDATRRDEYLWVEGNTLAAFAPDANASKTHSLDSSVSSVLLFLESTLKLNSNQGCY